MKPDDASIYLENLINALTVAKELLDGVYQGQLTELEVSKAQVANLTALVDESVTAVVAPPVNEKPL